MQQVAPYTITGRALLGEDLEEEDVAITVSGVFVTPKKRNRGTPEGGIVPPSFTATTPSGSPGAREPPPRGSLA